MATANETLLASVDGMDALTDEDFDESTQIMARLQAALEKWTSGQWNDEVEERTPTSGWRQGFVDHARRAEYGVGI